MSPSMEKDGIDYEVFKHIFSRAESDRDTLAKDQIHLAAFLCIPVSERLERCLGKHPEKLWVKIPNYFCLSTYDFMQYAYLQLGQDARAKALIEESVAVKKLIGVVSAGQMARAAVPARYMLERQDWQRAAQLQPLGTPFPAAEAVTHFARAMGAARSGNFTAAQTDIDKLKELRAGLEQAKQSYWAEQVEVQILCAQAWIAQGQGHKDEALKFMRAAADLEDASAKHVAMENRL